MISQAFRNFHLIEKGSFTIPAGGFFTFTRTGRTYPLVAIRSGALVGSTSQVVSGGTLTRIFQVPMGAAAVTVEFWLFDVLAAPPASFGLEVYDAASQLTYASGSAPLRVAGEVVISGFTNASGSYTAGRTYAGIQTFSGFAQQNDQVQFGPDLWLTKKLLGMSSWSGVAISCRRNFTDSKTSEQDEDIPGFTWEDQPPRWLIVDVTNL